MPDGQLQRRLGLTSAVSITVGGVIGSGIFLKPLSVAQNLPSEEWIYLLWVGLGVICLFGAFAYAELGAMLPEAGGQYAFLREGWGRTTSFLYGWTFFWVINTGTIAALAIAFANNLLALADIDGEWLRIAVAVGMIVMLAVVNHYGVGLGALLQNLSTMAKLAAIGMIILGGVLVVGGTSTTAAPVAMAGPVQLSLGGLVVAFTGIFWAYEGWYQLPFNAAELRRPERDLPRGLIYGMLILIATYTAVNAVYLHVVPLDEMRRLAADEEVPRLCISRIFAPEVSNYLTLLIAISVLGSANPNLLSSPRAFYAMGQDGLVPKALTFISPRWGTPVVAIWVQAVWAAVLVITLRLFHDVTVFVVFASLLFYVLAVASVYRLRAVRPEAHRPYRCLGYPWTPLLFILVTVFVVVTLLWDPSERKNALIGLAILGAGFPYYWLFCRRSKAQPTSA